MDWIKQHISFVNGLNGILYECIIYEECSGQETGTWTIREVPFNVLDVPVGQGKSGNIEAAKIDIKAKLKELV